MTDDRCGQMPRSAPSSARSSAMPPAPCSSSSGRPSTAADVAHALTMPGGGNVGSRARSDHRRRRAHDEPAQRARRVAREPAEAATLTTPRGWRPIRSTSARRPRASLGCLRDATLCGASSRRGARRRDDRGRARALHAVEGERQLDARDAPRRLGLPARDDAVARSRPPRTMRGSRIPTPRASTRAWPTCSRSRRSFARPGDAARAFDVARRGRRAAPTRRSAAGSTTQTPARSVAVHAAGRLRAHRVHACVSTSSARDELRRRAARDARRRRRHRHERLHRRRLARRALGRPRHPRGDEGGRPRVRYPARHRTHGPTSSIREAVREQIGARLLA